MSGHVNGWSVISRYLLMRRRTQSDLARLLHVSSAAITQIKQGRFRLSPGQIRAIAWYLQFDQTALDQFFSEIFNARMSLRALTPWKFTVKVDRR